MDFWSEVIIREDLAKDIQNVEFFVDLCKRNAEGFIPKTNCKKEVKELVNQVEMLRQMPKHQLFESGVN